jgi:phosphate starvation-inducible PhoH-like protein
MGGIDGIGIINLTTEDVVRHRLVKEIIKAYDKTEAEERARREQRKAEQQAEKERALSASLPEKSDND